MPIDTPTRKRQRGATIVLLLTMIPLVLVPLIGLAIDGTRLYIVQSKLSAAVDGAALGSGRLLGTNANITEIAGEFLNVNFPSGYWSTSAMTKNITFTTNLGTQTISVNASVVLPLTFARIMGQSGSLISATAVATRRVTRVEMVLDRSGSMNTNDPVTGANVFTTMKASAQWFAAQFTPNYDEVGLVMFNGSGLVAYPINRPWDPSTNGVGGPDKSFATDPQNQVGPIFTQLSNMAVGGGTGTPEALALAYIELQKAHYRDLAANGVDNTLNTLVLFTDGVPDAIPAYINNPSNNSLKPSGSGSNQSKCTYNPATGVASTQMRGYLVAPGGPPGNGVAFPGWGSPSDNTYALIQLGNYDTAHNLTWWEGSSGAGDLSAGAPKTALNGCAYLSTGGGGGSTSGAKDLLKIPDTDLYGYLDDRLGLPQFAGDRRHPHLAAQHRLLQPPTMPPPATTSPLPPGTKPTTSVRRFATRQP